ncbi:hypothetical protein GCM10008940_13390 [Microbulbifer agarilyticus]
MDSVRLAVNSWRFSLIGFMPARFKSKAGCWVWGFRIVVAMDGGAEAYMDVLAGGRLARS